MFGQLSDLLAPDYCYGCGFTGTVLCQSCFYDITSEPFGRCLSCLKPTGVDGSCKICRLPYQRAWTVGWRQGVLEKLVDASKFDSVRRACRMQAQLMAAVLPKLPVETVVVPVPTTRPHIRQRGYGHAELVARRLAKLRQLPYQPVLQRRGHSVQHGVSRRQRQLQAKQAYRVDDQLDDKAIYLLVDDVYTTGATVKHATRQLRQAGAKQVWLAVTSRQPLD